MSETPSSRAYGRHVFICTHGDCAEPEAGERLHQRFGELNREYGLNKLRNPQRVKCSMADCLGICSGGPIVTVYPEGIWYHHVDEAVLERIYHEHILGGQPVEEFIFHRLYPIGQEPAYPPTVRGDAESEEAEGRRSEEARRRGGEEMNGDSKEISSISSPHEIHRVPSHPLPMPKPSVRRLAGRGRKRGWSLSIPAMVKVKRQPHWA